MKHDEDKIDSIVGRISFDPYCSGCIGASEIEGMIREYHEHMMSAEPKILYADVVKKQAMIRVLDALDEDCRLEYYTGPDHKGSWDSLLDDLGLI